MYVCQCICIDSVMDEHKNKATARALIEQKVHEIGIRHFRFFQSDKKSKHTKWSFSSLMGPDKLKLFSRLKLSELMEKNAEWQQKIWRDFMEINSNVKMWANELATNNITPAIIRSKVTAWLKYFSSPGIGRPLSRNFIPGHFPKDEITPYMHLLQHHVPELIERHGCIAKFSSAVTERCNFEDGNAFFATTSRRISNGESLKELLMRRLRILFNPEATSLYRYTCSCEKCGKQYVRPGNLKKHITNSCN